MTVSTTSSSVIFLGNGITTNFSFNFIGVASADIFVYLNNAGTLTTLSPSQYTLVLNAPATGSLWGIGGTITYPTSGPAIGNTESLVVSRVVPLTQLTTISNQGDFYPQVVEEALDTLCFEIQQVSARTGQLRGEWAANTAYNFGDIVQDGANGANTLNYYTCIIANTSSSSWANDLAAGDWMLGIDTQLISGYASTASSAAATATTQAGIATTQAGIATTAATSASSSATTASAAAITATTGANTATTQAAIATAAAITAETFAGQNAANTFSGNGVTTSFTLSSTPLTKNNVQVYISGVYQDKSNFSISGNTLIFVTAPATGTNNIEAMVTTASVSSSGTVTSVSVASANGFTGSVANATTTPAITMSTSITGILKGNGNAISAAVSNTDYQAPITLTTTGTSGAATFSANTLNVPNYAVGGGTVTTTGSPSSGNLSKFSGATSITSGDLSGDVTTSGTLATTIAKIAGVSVGTPTGTGNVVFSNSPTFVTPALGTPVSGVATNLTGTASGLTAGLVTAITGQISAGTNVTITGSGTTGSPYVVTSTNTAATAFSALTGSTNTTAAMVVGTGASLAASGSGTITATATPAAGITGTTLASNVVTSSLTTVGTIATGVWNGTKLELAYGGTNADLSATGGTSQVLKQTSSGGAITVAQLAASDLSNGTTGSGSVVLSTSPTLVTPALGTPASGVLTNCTGYPVTVNGVSTFSGNGATTAFTLGGSPTSKNNTLVYISGVYQNKANYSLAGAVITFTTAPASGTNNIEVVYS